MIIWVASYPKSGNTWVRSIISSLVYTEDGIFNFPSIKKIDQYPQRRFLEYFTRDYNNIHEIKKHWITSQEKINLDRSKQLMGQQQFDEKLEQNEDLAELRAETSLVKQEMANDVKLKQDRFKQRDVRILKGPRR